MGLFQKKVLPIVAPKYSLGHQDTVLIVGLGNIGTRYDNTRHNTGFSVLDLFTTQESFNPWVEKKELQSYLCAKVIDGKRVILCKPTTMMNLSGTAVQKVSAFYKVPHNSICVIYDELDLTLGTLRTGAGGQSAGHNGIGSLLEHLNNSFWRIRVGIGPKQPSQIDTADFVLQKYSKSEQGKLHDAKKEAVSLLNEWLSGQASAETRKV